MHEDMLFYRGECVTHWEFRYFRRIGVFGELDQYDLLYNFIILQGHTISLVQSMGQVCRGYIPGPPKN